MSALGVSERSCDRRDLCDLRMGCAAASRKCSSCCFLPAKMALHWTRSWPAKISSLTDACALHPASLREVAKNFHSAVLAFLIPLLVTSEFEETLPRPAAWTGYVDGLQEILGGLELGSLARTYDSHLQSSHSCDASWTANPKHPKEIGLKLFFASRETWNVKLAWAPSPRPAEPWKESDWHIGPSVGQAAAAAVAAAAAWSPLRGALLSGLERRAPAAEQVKGPEQKLGCPRSLCSEDPGPPLEYSEEHLRWRSFADCLKACRCLLSWRCLAPLCLGWAALPGKKSHQSWNPNLMSRCHSCYCEERHPAA